MTAARLSYRCTDRGHRVTSPEPMDDCPVCGGPLEPTTPIDIPNTVKVKP